MNLKTPKEVAAFTQDILPAVRVFVEALLSRAKFRTALDFGKVLIDLQVFETIDQALVLGYIFEHLVDKREIVAERFSIMIAGILAHSSLSENPTADFLFSLLTRAGTEGLSRKNFSDFLSFYNDMFVPKTEEEASDCEKPQLVSFVFRKKKHQSEVSKIYNELKLISTVIDRGEGNDLFKGELIDFFYNSEVFKSQIKSLYLPCRHLCFFIFERMSSNESEINYPLKPIRALRVCSHQESRFRS